MGGMGLEEDVLRWIRFWAGGVDEWDGVVFDSDDDEIYLNKFL